MENHHHPSHHHHHHDKRYHSSTSQHHLPGNSSRRWSGSTTPQAQQGRREWLWRKRLELELEVHQLLAQQEQALRELHLIEQRRACVQRQRPQIIAHILLTGLVGMLSPGERAYHYMLERLAQEERYELGQWNWCQAQRSKLTGQIATINVELALLDAGI